MTYAARIATAPGGAKTVPLLTAIAEAFAAERIRYCQWKGHFRHERWQSGVGDIDILVAPESLPRLLEVLRIAGFLQTVAPDDYKHLGTAHYRAPDPETGRMLHLHVHTRLLIEAARGTVYRLPLEEALLARTTAVPGVLFRTPTPALEALVLVLRTNLRWASWRRVPKETREELAYLESLGSTRQQADVLHRYLAAVTPEIYERCRRALNSGTSLRERWSARRALAGAMKAFARHPTLWERIDHAARAAAWHLRGGPRTDSQARLINGGQLIVVSGTDGSGKSTCVAAVAKWLRPHVRVMTAHVGRPPRSLPTLAAAGLLRVGRLPLFRWLWNLAIARDRYRLAVRAWDFALDGGVALCERYPMRPNHPLVGPRVRELAGPNPSRLARWLARIEERYYTRIPRPEHVFVLDVDPDVAVRRKTDEPSDYVRARAELMLRADWTGTTARHLDAGRPLDAVITELRDLVWQTL